MNGVEPELVIRYVMIAWGLGLVVGAWTGYALRGPKVNRLQETIDALRQKLDAVQGALE